MGKGGNNMQFSHPPRNSEKNAFSKYFCTGLQLYTCRLSLCTLGISFGPTNAPKCLEVWIFYVQKRFRLEMERNILLRYVIVKLFNILYITLAKCNMPRIYIWCFQLAPVCSDTVLVGNGGIYIFFLLHGYAAFS